MDRKALQTEGTGQCGQGTQMGGKLCMLFSIGACLPPQSPMPVCGEAALFNISVSSPSVPPDEKASGPMCLLCPLA